MRHCLPWLAVACGYSTYYPQAGPTTVPPDPTTVPCDLAPVECRPAGPDTALLTFTNAHIDDITLWAMDPDACVEVPLLTLTSGSVWQGSVEQEVLHIARDRNGCGRLRFSVPTGSLQQSVVVP
jgi:hypothetical protein